MIPRLLISCDLHLTDDPAHAYRWEVFPFLKKMIRKHEITHVYIIGDVCEAKDNHSAVLVNLVVQGLKSLAEDCDVTVVMGNHDYRDRNSPFFAFITDIKGLRFVSEPSSDLLLSKGENVRIALIPHMQSFPEGWADAFKDARLVLCHQTFTGARSEAGRSLHGVGESEFSSHFKKSATILAGDVHTPQQVGRITYVGAPHPVDYGDDFECRVGLWTREDGFVAIPRKTTRKVILRGNPKEIEAQLADLRPGDKARIITAITREDAHVWDELEAKLRRVGDRAGVELDSIEPTLSQALDAEVVLRPEESDPTAVLARFLESHEVDDRLEKTLGRVLRAVLEGPQ